MKRRFLFIVVGQPLWFRLHVRCPFYHSIHKDNGGSCGTQSQVKKLRDLVWKRLSSGSHLHSSNHFNLPFAFAFLLHEPTFAGQDTSGFPSSGRLCPLPFPFQFFFNSQDSPLMLTQPLIKVEPKTLFSLFTCHQLLHQKLLFL